MMLLLLPALPPNMCGKGKRIITLPQNRLELMVTGTQTLNLPRIQS
jgi:hypothetical protein